jgi:site-specific DNA recombinase
MYRTSDDVGASVQTMRAAIYTRVSTDESLGMEFNSLDAQREACAAYITSQRHEGWEEVDTRYDDGGYSGGSMKRPALERLLADVGAGRVDVIVVYKIDRLTRSLADFSRIVDVLDARGASFISITQAFSTTTSMGRLTLNVLLSFAQFEREVGAERVRDKIASSKKKGMWMGGTVPLGYDVQDRKLVVNEEQAETVRTIFARYIALRSVILLEDDLKERGIVSARRISKRGRASGGTAFTRGALYNLLQNVAYIGKVRHRVETYAGQHDAILDADIFDEAQAILTANRADHRHGKGAREPSILTGLLFDEQGQRLTPSHTTKGSKRFRYYVGRSPGRESARRFRIPAREIERKVIGEVADWISDAHRIEACLSTGEADAVALEALLLTARQCGGELGRTPPARVRELLLALVQRIHVGEAQLAIDIDPNALFGLGGLAAPAEALAAVTLKVPCQLVRRSYEVKLAVTPAGSSSTHIDPSLVKLLVKAHVARAALLAGNGASLADIAKSQGHEPHYFSVLVKLSYLAPDITQVILEGRHPLRLNRQCLARIRKLPAAWQAQRRLIGEYGDAQASE